MKYKKLALYFAHVKNLECCMTLQAMYDAIASQHAMANRFGSLSDSHRCAIAQIQQAHLGQGPHYKVLDLGVGNGAFLQELRQHMPLAEFTGIDVSKDMLKQASEALPLTTIETSATEANRFLPYHSQDLVLAHFINAYIPIKTLFHQAALLSRSDGYFSIITTTYDSFPVAQEQLAAFVSKESLLSSIIGHYYKAAVRNTTVAANETELLLAFSDHQFKVIEHQRLHIPITFNNIDELAQFGIEGTWFLNNVTIRMLPKNFLLARLKRLFGRIFTFPYHDTHIIDVVLAKK
jgi:SAM-dependent methyltransferase